MSSFIELNSKSVHTVNETDDVQTVSSGIEDVMCLGQVKVIDLEQTKQRPIKQKQQAQSYISVNDDSEDEGLHWGKAQRHSSNKALKKDILDFDADFLELAPQPHKKRS